MINLLIIIVLILLIKIIWNPKIDITMEKEVLLWYGSSNNRKYIKLN
jgi:hypothetical protein